MRFSISRRGNVNTRRAQIDVADQTVEIIYKDIKNLHLSVHPPVGRVRVAAPLRLDNETVRLAVVSRLAWIKRQQERLARQVRQSQREMVTGESHYYLGRRHRLVVVDAPHRGARISRPGVIELSTRVSADRESKERILREWYRRELRNALTPLLLKWEMTLGTSVHTLGVKRMKTRWGTCNPTKGRIWLNLELVKKPLNCIEYVLLHELLHFQERGHGEAFVALMGRHMPTWQLHRDELNRAPLAHESWSY